MILDIYGEYYFYPSWEKYPPIDFISFEFEPYQEDKEEILNFIMPDFEGIYEDLKFYSGITDEGVTQLLSNIDVESFTLIGGK